MTKKEHFLLTRIHIFGAFGAENVENKFQLFRRLPKLWRKIFHIPLGVTPQYPWYRPHTFA